MDEFRRCRATSSRTGLPCNNYAIVGGVVCRVHGGSAPQVRAAARRNLAEQQAQAATMAEVGVVPVDDPVEAFQTLVAEVITLKDHFASKVARLEETESLRYESSYRTEQARSELLIYERLIDRAGRLLGLWISLGMEARRDEHRALLAERHGRVIDGVLRKVIEGMFAWATSIGVAPDDVRRFETEGLPRLVRGALSAVVPPEELLAVTDVPPPPPPPPPPPIPVASEDGQDDEDDMAWARFSEAEKQAHIAAGLPVTQTDAQSEAENGS